MDKSVKLIVRKLKIDILPDTVHTTLERRVFFLIISLSFILTILGNISNVVFGMPLPLIIVTFLASLLSFSLLIFLREKSNLEGYTYLLFFSSLIFIIASWFFNGGIDGPNLYIILLFSIAVYIIAPRKVKFFTFLSYLVLSSVLIIIFFRYPDLINNYVNKNERFGDLFMSNICFMFSFYYMIVLVLRNYEYEQKKVEKHNIDLNLLNLELSRKNELIKSYSGGLKEANETKDHFFSIIAHDLRAPYSPILGLSEILINSADELTKTEIIEIATKLNNVSRNGLTLLENLLEWARLQTDSIEFYFEEVDPKELILGMTSIYRPIAEEKQIILESDTDEITPIYVDENTIKTVLRNLISNAIKFTPRGGKIRISTKVENSIFLITVKDSGIGISTEDINKLFRKDIKFMTKGTEGENGTGFGLLLSHDYVKKNGGKIKVESESGKGTSFSISLPLSQKNR